MTSHRVSVGSFVVLAPLTDYYTYDALSISIEYLSSQPPDKVSRMSKRKNPHAVALGRIGGKKGGSKGGKTSAAKMTPEERRDRARKAALARWKKAAR